MGANPVANGGVLRKSLRLPNFRDYGAEVKQPGTVEVGNTGRWASFSATSSGEIRQFSSFWS